MPDILTRAAGPVAGLPSLSRPTTSRLFRLAQDLSRRTELWRPRVAFAQDTRYAVRIAVTDEYEAWLLTWLPGQSTGLHDHGGSAGAFAVVEGVVDEAVLAPSTARAPGALVHHSLPAGRVRAFGGAHLHDVTNVGREPAVTLHVYAPALSTMRRFALDGSGGLQVVARERSGVDW